MALGRLDAVATAWIVRRAQRGGAVEPSASEPTRPQQVLPLVPLDRRRPAPKSEPDDPRRGRGVDATYLSGIYMMDRNEARALNAVCLLLGAAFVRSVVKVFV